MNKIIHKFLFCIQFPIKNGIRNYTPRRAVMYVPGDDSRKLEKAFKLDVDCIVMDCEDGVAINKKDEARQTIKSILEKGKPLKDRQYDLGVRINAPTTPYFKDDVKEILCAKSLPDTILLPKVDNVEILKMFSNEVKQTGISKEARINLIIYIESALAFLNLRNICESSFSLCEQIVPSCLVFGSDDFCASVGVSRTDDSTEILYARQKLVLVAKAFNLQAIDMVYIKYKDLEGLQRQSKEGANMGFTGKQVIHPAQVPVVQEAFLPNKQQIEWAKGLLSAFEDHQKSGKGAFTYKGSMIDMPTMKQAKNIINFVNIVKK